MIVVAGAGYLGTRLAAGLRQSGHPVTALTLSGEGETIACDLGDAAAVNRLAGSLASREITAVIHCASSNRRGAAAYQSVFRDGITHLRDAFPGTRLVLTSSTSTYAQTSGEIVDESSPAEPDRETGKWLREAEEITLDAGGSVARLAGIYGPGRCYLLLRTLQGRARIDISPAAPDGRWINQIHRDDAATALARLAENQLPGIFNVADGTPLLQRDCLTRLAARLDLPPPEESPPDTGRKRAWTHKRIGIEKLKTTGWVPRFPDFFQALDTDRDLVPSIRARLAET